MPSLADQSVDQLGGPWSVLTRQKRDHVRLDRLLHELEGTSGAAQERVLHAIARLVFPHAFAEESVLWPVLRRVLPDGEELTLQVEQEHQEVNEIWSRLESSELDAEERRSAIDRLVEVLREDVRDEEDELLPRLQEAVPPSRLRQLGVAWEVVRRTAPTRPHPVVSRRPPGNALAALPLTVIDHGRDLVDAAARRTGEETSARLRSASQAMARAAGRIEHVGVLRRGERPSTRRG
ncbi:hemerythrin domain-containing protein [Nocardioides lijunqiniae]|uniref:hemerythrin domain-containing protein n=1 Tax=Nocardioides lijunqiniae TaxID=2760832 RepID=UPI001877CB47|nr:hemerythrin domain-containing protein [Nocardioides lijunqiniae]